MIFHATKFSANDTIKTTEKSYREDLLMKKNYMLQLY